MNFLLRLWCSTRREHVTTNLKRLFKFGITIYGKAWFDALKHPSIVDGPRVFHRLVVSLWNFDGFVDFGDKEDDGILYFAVDRIWGPRRNRF